MNHPASASKPPRAGGRIVELGQIKCKGCGEPLAAGQVNLQAGLAPCATCNAVFSAAGQGTRTPTPAPPPRPSRVETNEFGPAKEWRWRWWSWRYMGTMMFALFWLGFTLLWFRFIVVGDILKGGPEGLKVMFVGLVFLVMGLGFGYVALAGIRNTTTIRHAPGVLEIIHRPYHRFFGGGRWQTGTFTSLQFKTVHGSKGSKSYHLEAARSDGKPVNLLTDSNERDLIRFLAHELAAAMNLPLGEMG